MAFPWASVFFITMIGLLKAGIIVSGGGTPLALGKFIDPSFAIGVISIVATIFFIALKIKGALLLEVTMDASSGSAPPEWIP